MSSRVMSEGRHTFCLIGEAAPILGFFLALGGGDSGRLRFPGVVTIGEDVMSITFGSLGGGEEQISITSRSTSLESGAAAVFCCLDALGVVGVDGSGVVCCVEVLVNRDDEGEDSDAEDDTAGFAFWRANMA